jgi:hypothetical protein
LAVTKRVIQFNIFVFTGSDFCNYGDYRGLMHIDEANPKVSCGDMVAKFPEQCYNPDKVNRCCEACPSIRNKERPGINWLSKLQTTHS